MEIVDAILLFKENKTLADAAQESLDVLRKGGDPNAIQDELFLGFLNTPMSENRYVRVRCDPYYATALEYIQEGETVGLVQVLWEGVEELETDCGRFADA